MHLETLTSQTPPKQAEEHAYMYLCMSLVPAPASTSIVRTTVPAVRRLSIRRCICTAALPAHAAEALRYPRSFEPAAAAALRVSPSDLGTTACRAQRSLSQTATTGFRGFPATKKRREPCSQCTVSASGSFASLAPPRLSCLGSCIQ